MRMRQSLAEIESAFTQEIEEDRERRERLAHSAVKRTHQRKRERVHRHGSARFFLLCLVLLTTAVLVTVVMFQTLAWVMG